MLVTCPKCSARYQIPSEISLKKGQKLQCSACEHVFQLTSVAPEKPVSEKVLVPPTDAVLSVSTKTIQFETKSTEKAVPKEGVLPEVFRPVKTKNEKHFALPWLILSCAVLIGLIFVCWLWRDLLVINTSFEETLVSTPSGETGRPFVPAPQQAVAQKPEKTPLSAQMPSAEADPTPSAGGNTNGLSVHSVRFRQAPTGAVLIEGVLKNISSEDVFVPEKMNALGYGKDGSLVFKKQIYLPSGVLHPGMEQAFFGTHMSEEREIQWVDVVLQK